jgi:hypothetical protein
VQEQLDKVPLFAQAIKEERQELARRVRSLTVGTEDYIIRVRTLNNFDCNIYCIYCVHKFWVQSV